MMNFFENELRKIVEPNYPESTFVGRACYVRLGEMNRAKIQFVTTGCSTRYTALRLTILNRQEGDVDNLLLRFSDLLGRRLTANPNSQNGAELHILDDGREAGWFLCEPTSRDYQVLSNAVSEYLEVFMEQTQTADQQWTQTMQ